VGYVFSNRTLRWLAVALSIGNAGWGMVLVAMPVLVFRLHGNAAVVGGLLALQGVFGIPSTLLAGRVNSAARERHIMAVMSAATAAATLALLVPVLAVIAVATAAVGLLDGPMSVALFSLRQRRTHPAWYGRAFAISASLNFSGLPLGAALSGPIIGASVTLAIIVAACLAAAQTVIIIALVPARAAATSRVNEHEESEHQRRVEPPVGGHGGGEVAGAQPEQPEHQAAAEQRDHGDDRGRNDQQAIEIGLGQGLRLDDHMPQDEHC